MIRTMLTLLAVVFFFSFNAYAQAPQASSTEAQKPPFEDDGTTRADLLGVLPTDIVAGSKDAPVTIVEYASMSCSHCAAFHNNAYGPLKEKYIDTGKVKFILRDFPLNEQALRGSMLARCAGEEKFEKFVDVMFSTQSNWITKKNFLEILSNIGKLGGMSGETFDACMADKSLEESVMRSKYNGVTKLEVRSTPTFFVNGEEYKGVKKFEYFAEVIDNLLGEGGQKADGEADKGAGDAHETGDVEATEENSDTPVQESKE